MKMHGSRWMALGLTVVGGALLAIGCSRRPPQEIADVNRELAKAKDGCATVYATQDLARVQSEVDSMNSLADAKKYRKARKEAVATLPDVQSLETKAAAARSDAKSAAEAALAKAESAYKEAQAAEAGRYASSEYAAAQSKIEAARAKMDDPCGYLEGATLAADAEKASRAAAAAAVAEKKRLEEEARRKAEEEARRRAEEEARRKAEEEARLRAHPPTYVVQKGDYLWKISGMDKIYHNSVLWPIIYDANTDTIHDPDLIYPGQKLTIPRDLSDAEMQQKLYHLWRVMGNEEQETE